MKAQAAYRSYVAQLLLLAGIAPTRSEADTRAAADYVTMLPGGFGAVREVCELILKAHGVWDDLMKRYLN